ncbi:MAG TPA: hypothetical protein VIM58_12450 [Candidatus Methylacidiphilales bacterium]
MRARLPILCALGLCLGLAPAWSQDGEVGPQPQPLTLAPVETSVSTPAPNTAIPIEVTADGDTNYVAGLTTATDNVIVRYGGDLLYADKVVFDSKTKTAIAEGNVRIYTGPRLYRGDHITYNFETHSVTSTDFALASFPVFSAGRAVSTPDENHYRITDGYVTTENRTKPGFRIKAHTIEIYPNDRVVLKNVVFYVGDVPVMWMPFFYQDLQSNDTTVSFRAGTNSRFGVEALTTVNWRVNKDLQVAFHEDYRSRRGEAGGVDLKFHPIKDATGFFRAYEVNDDDANENPTALPRSPISRDRYLFALQQIFPVSDGLTGKINANVWSDPYITEDFFRTQYAAQRMPDNTLEFTQWTPNFEITALGRLQPNRFFDGVERAPEVDFQLKPINIFGSPVQYQMDSSVVNFERVFSNQQYYSTAPLPKDYSAYRWDTYHQFLLPQQYFGWLNSTPHVGFRGTAWNNDNKGLYTDGVKDSASRAVVDAGEELSFKLSQTWTEIKVPGLAVDGLRHTMEPYVNFEAVLPSAGRDVVQGFDDRVVNSWANPIGFPAWNSIDTIDRQIVARTGIRNKIQTKRDGKNWDLFSWDLFTDVNFASHYDEEQILRSDTVSHLYSDATIKPFPWLQFDSRAAIDTHGNSYDMYDHSLTWQPDRAYAFTLGDRLLQNVTAVDFYGLPIQNSNNIYIRNFWRINEHWQFGTYHAFDTSDSHLSEQTYTLYRDLSSWQVGLSVSERNNRNSESDQSVFLTFTLKAFPNASIRVSE